MGPMWLEPSLYPADVYPYLLDFFQFTNTSYTEGSHLSENFVKISKYRSASSIALNSEGYFPKYFPFSSNTLQEFLILHIPLTPDVLLFLKGAFLKFSEFETFYKNFVAVL